MGTTPTERYLQGLARRSFLSLWSHGNPHTPEGRRGNKGAGKELCDLLVIFGENILMFSDKDIQFQRDIDIGIAWGRWYRRAVEKSADQLAGALKWLNRFPQEVYLDALCTSRLPTSIPDISRYKIHLICIANGAYNSCRAFFGNSGIGSLVVDLTLKGHQQHTQPFHVGAMSGRTSGLFTFLMTISCRFCIQINKNLQANTQRKSGCLWVRKRIFWPTLENFVIHILYLVQTTTLNS